MSRARRRQPVRSWTGPERRYDLITEGTIAVIVVAVLCILAAIIWGSPNAGLTYPGGPKSLGGQAFSARYWVHSDPSDFAQTAVGELAGTTRSAGYGPPFTQTGASQSIIGIKPTVIAKAIFGLTLPINTAHDFVLTPLSEIVAPPVPVIVHAEMLAANSGTLDAYFQSSPQQLSTNTYKATMFYSDGQLWYTIGQAQGISGSQWGVMNEVWNFPGQVWLWLWLYAGES